MHVVNGKGNLLQIFAGFFVLLSVALGVFVSPYWLLFTVFVGVNLIISGTTGFCLLEKILLKLGVQEKKVYRL